MIQRLCVESVEVSQTRRSVCGIGKSFLTFSQHPTVQIDDPFPYGDICIGVVEVAERRSAELIGRSTLMDQPDDLVRVPGEICRELGANDQVNRAAVALTQVDEAPGGGVGEDLFLRILLEWQADKLRRETVLLELVDEGPDVVFGTSGDERHLSLAHDNRSN